MHDHSEHQFQEQKGFVQKRLRTVCGNWLYKDYSSWNNMAFAIRLTCALFSAGSRLVKLVTCHSGRHALIKKGDSLSGSLRTKTFVNRSSRVEMHYGWLHLVWHNKTKYL